MCIIPKSGVCLLGMFLLVIINLQYSFYVLMYLACMWRLQDQTLTRIFILLFSPYSMQLILGDHDVRVFEGTEQLLKTENIIWHPKQVLFFLSNEFSDRSAISYHLKFFHILSSH